MIDEDYKYENEIRCKVCKALLGYAPYWRTDYRCVSCNDKAVEEP